MNQGALIGHTGFVGSNLKGQLSFDGLFSSINVNELKNTSWDLIVCAGIQAKKWWANANPEADRAGIASLLEVLTTVRAQRFVLISTVDVYPHPSGVDETSPIDSESNHAYGKHRFMAENFVRDHFADHLVLRLPGLFGTGIKKNVIHDLIHRHELEKINPSGVYQYYPLDRLGADMTRCQELGLRLLNVSAEPISTGEIVERFFPDVRVGKENPFQTVYDVKSCHWRDWGSALPGYLYDKASVLDHLEAFLSRTPGT